jgi:hypothetical protein
LPYPTGQGARRWTVDRSSTRSTRSPPVMGWWRGQPTTSAAAECSGRTTLEGRAALHGTGRIARQLARPSPVRGRRTWASAAGVTSFLSGRQEFSMTRPAAPGLAREHGLRRKGFTCPVAGASANPTDEAEGYCGACTAGRTPWSGRRGPPTSC